MKTLPPSFFVIQLPPVKESVFKDMAKTFKVKSFTAKKLGAIFRKRGIEARNLFHNHIIVIETTTNPMESLKEIQKLYPNFLILGLAYDNQYYHTGSLQDLTDYTDLIQTLDQTPHHLINLVQMKSTEVVLLVANKHA